VVAPTNGARPVTVDASPGRTQQRGAAVAPQRHRAQPRPGSAWTSLPRALHPGAWWLWALGLATAASRTTNPLLLLVVLAVAWYVVTARRSTAPWARSFTVFLKLGLVVVLIRVVAQVVFGAAAPGTTIVTLPEMPLPAWFAGVSIGGPITREALAAAVVEGLRLATVLGCIGAANALANPKRLLASLPAALYETGVVVVVALSFAPSLVTSVGRIRAARRLRGRPDRGLRSIVGVAMPVLEDALERSLALAASMDARGYGRQAAVPRGQRRLTAGLTLAGLVGTCLGVYGLLDGTGPVVLGAPMLLAGLVAAAAGLRLGGKRAIRSRYRPDPWLGPEWLTAASGAAAAGGAILGGVLDPAGLAPDLVPLAALPLPLVPALGVLAALLPAWCTPPPPDLAVPGPRSWTRRDARAAAAAPAGEVTA
jgi:energy-coupling factor transport system permease protein